MNERNTIQRALVLDAVRGMSNHPTADEVYEAVSAKCPTVSKATVYRNLNRLAGEGDILRVAVANAPDRFDKTTFPHAHFRCRLCGRVFDYTLSGALPLGQGLNRSFVVESYTLLVSGHCKNCQEVTT